MTGVTVELPETRYIDRYDDNELGKCVVRLLREVGDLTEVVLVLELTFTPNGDFAHTVRVFTDVEKLYSLDTVPVEWTELKDSAKIVCLVFMTAVLQAMD